MRGWVSGELQQEQAPPERQTQNEQLDEFGRVVSHELRSPLNAIEGRLELAKEACDSDHLGPIDDAVSRMESLIDNLLVLARTDEQVCELETVDLAEIVTSY
ncbi:sensor histidine kinase [Halorubrum tebenquichense]|uniref:sensor histidine kinase n=1 Tax=Halorubrum tebenquichense TaxID=119434 RepID=UPI0009E64A52